MKSLVLGFCILLSVLACKQEPVSAPSSTPVPTITTVPSPVGATTPDPVVTPTSEAPSRYIKISNKGAKLPRAAKLGAGIDDWACTLDTQTGKMWEVKTTQGLHNFQNMYGWYDPSAADKGISDEGKFYGNKGLPYTPDPKTICHQVGRCDTAKFTADVNASGFCGHSDWRLPTKEELLSIVVCPKGKNSTDWLNGYPCVDYLNDGNTNHIDQEFFPNSGPITREYSTIFGPKTFVNYSYWTSDNYDPIPSSAFFVKFLSGGEDRDLKSLLQAVRLIRSVK